MSTVKQKILIVDDEPDILELIEYNLKKEGYQVYLAGNGQEGITIAKKVHPDLIILDIMMPKMDGIEACRLMRAIPEFKNTFMVFLTARSEEYSEIAGFNVGADDYIAKPIKPRALVSRINAYIGFNLKDGTTYVYKIDAAAGTAVKGLKVEGGLITAIQHLP